MIFNINKRDIYGLIGWFIVSIFITILAIPIMIIREVYQWKHYNLSKFEWEDVIRYSIVILLGSVINYLLIFN